MESRNIEKALEISAKLAAGETVSEQGTNAALYQEYSTNPEVYDMVLLSLKKMELSVYEYNNSLFAAPKAHGSLFGYSNEALRRELGLRTNGELYLAYFISCIHQFLIGAVRHIRKSLQCQIFLNLCTAHT